MAVRLAVVSDIHGNLPALEAVIADLAETEPDQVVLGGDLAMGGPHAPEVIDRLRELGWPSVLGNTDVALSGPEAIPQAARGGFIPTVAAHTSKMLGRKRTEWLTGLPMEWRADDLVVVHAVPGDCWAIVSHDAPDATMRETYSSAGAPIVIYGHIHHAFVRRLGDLTVVNSGSVSLSLDRDVRATYVIVDGDQVEHRRVDYDLEKVADDYYSSGYPMADSYVSWLRAGAWTPP
jgi:putative phosphoesterase